MIDNGFNAETVTGVKLKSGVRDLWQNCKRKKTPNWSNEKRILKKGEKGKYGAFVALRSPVQAQLGQPTDLVTSWKLKARMVTARGFVSILEQPLPASLFFPWYYLHLYLQRGKASIFTIIILPEACECKVSQYVCSMPFCFSQEFMRLFQKLVPLSDSILSKVPCHHRTCLSRPH